jgi:hypothetical protein
MEPPQVEPLLDQQERTAFIIENSLQPSQTCSLKNIPPHIFSAFHWLQVHEVSATITEYLQERIPSPSPQSRIAARITISLPRRSDTDPLLSYIDLDKIQNGIMLIISSYLVNTAIVSIHTMQQVNNTSEFFSILLSVTVIAP